MVRSLCIACICLLSALPLQAQTTKDSSGFFNEKDLTGWEGLPQYWSVKDKAIVGFTEEDPKFNTFLCSKKKYKDFEMSFQIMIENGVGNSGVQIRSEVFDAEKFKVKGPQCDMGQQYWGSLYGEGFGGMMKQSPAEVVKKVVKPKEFNAYYIKCVGKAVTIRINGETMVEGEFPKMPDEGIIALQLHAGYKSMKVVFKDITFKEIKTEKPKNPPKPMLATAAESLKVMKDFKVELLYSVPKEEQGSWVNICTDPKGRLIVSDQYGWLYRVTPPPVGTTAGSKVERLPKLVGGAHGLLYAFDSLYVMINEGINLDSAKPGRGLYRLRSKDQGDTYEEPELLKKLEGSGEHGLHAILLTPDKKSLTIVCGNNSKMVSPLNDSRVPRIWGEDHLLPRLRDGNGFMAGVLGPGGCIYKTDPDGKTWELLSTGYRNQFDAAYNHVGDLFTYDADMEWDVNTPWYRPTRVCLVSSGSEYGWRNGAGKWPGYYVDNLPGVFNVGLGSPTGVCFGHGAKFPVKYQKSMIICDWSYGKLYAVHLNADGSSYKGEAEEFVIGNPLPLTDVIVNPTDGAVYFTVGGRRTQSGLYRLTYTGKESTAPMPLGAATPPERTLRLELESLHKVDATAVEKAWPHLNHADRFVRFAARTAIEHQPVESWKEKALKETDPVRSIHATLALARAAGKDPFHHPRKDGPIPNRDLLKPMLTTLEKVSWGGLTMEQKLDLIRTYHVVFNRFGEPEKADATKLLSKFDPIFPAVEREINSELCQLLVFLQSKEVVAKAVKMMNEALTQEEQLEYARALRAQKQHWTLDLRKSYFSWFQKASGYKGGNSFQGFLNLIKADAEKTLVTDEEKAMVKEILAKKVVVTQESSKPARPFVKKWSMGELRSSVDGKLTARNFEKGRKMFSEAKCYSCHRFDNEGGSQGPDLTGAAGRFNVNDLLESILDPNKEISDQYVAMVVSMEDGKLHTGRIVNHNGDTMTLMADMLNPNGLVSINTKKIDTIDKSKVSLMPEGLLDHFSDDEIRDLLAFILSRGDRNNTMFKK